MKAATQTATQDLTHAKPPPLETAPRSIFAYVPRLHPVLPRCEHGVYNPEGDVRARYCTICTPVTIQGEVLKRIKTAVGPLTLVIEKRALGYDVDKYRKEINAELKYVRSLLGPPKQDEAGFATSGFGTSWRDLNDLKQTVDIEIAKATEHYKDKGGMNGALARIIVRNQAGRFLTDQIEEQKVEVTIPVLDEFGEPIGKQTVPVLDEFGKPKQVARFESFDAEETDEDGEPRENSRIEEKIVMEAQPPPTSPTLDKFISEFAKLNRLPLLRALVDGWKAGSAKRIIGELFLAMPDTTVREFPGVSKSNAARVLKVVRAEFKAVLDGDMGQDQKV